MCIRRREGRKVGTHRKEMCKYVNMTGGRCQRWNTGTRGNKDVDVMRGRCNDWKRWESGAMWGGM